jgi:hypothetical protein
MRFLPLQMLVVVTLMIGCVVDGPADAPCQEGLACVEPTPCAIDADCDDGLFCNGVEACDVDLGCVAGKTPSCDDGLACTADECDEELDVCSFVPDVPVPDALGPVSIRAGEVSWELARLADGATASYDLLVDGDEVRDLTGTTYASPVAAGATVRVRACHPCTGECGPWSEGVAVE